ncbi:MAG: AAA family ATPase [Canibacter sp.]
MADRREDAAQHDRNVTGQFNETEKYNTSQYESTQTDSTLLVTRDHGVTRMVSQAADSGQNEARGRDDTVTNTSAGPRGVHHDVNDFRAVHREWRRELATIGGRNPLLHFEDELRNRIDLSTTHPGGLAQFITGQKILLSVLIRDDLALRHARVAAGRVTDKAAEMRNVRGLETVHLGVGIANWTFEGEKFCAPVLLRPLAIRRFGRDYELKLKKQVTVNPDLIQALRDQFGIVVNARTLLELSQAEGVFKPQPVIDRLRQMAAGVHGFSVQPRLVVSSFRGVASDMVKDAVNLDTTLLNAVCGSRAARAQLRNSYRPVTAVPPNERSPETDRNLYDADAEQDDVIAQIEAGHSLVVRTLPGAGGTQTVVNALGGLVRSGKSVLVVSPRRATLDGIAHRLSRVGLPGLATTPHRLRRSLVDAIRRNEQPADLLSQDIDQALVRLRGVLGEYQTALDEKDSQLEASPVQALRELARLAAAEHPPQTTVRLSDGALRSLALERGQLAEALTEVARLGQFQYGPEDSPWYGVSFSNSEDAKKAYQRAVDLSESKLPRLFSLADEVIEQTNLREFETVAELGVYLRLLSGIRETLDRFSPDVFDRSLTEVIAAHAPRGNDNMNQGDRRRLKKLAREYVRPGGQVTDMYSRLVSIQQQRVLWQRYCTIAGARPEVPTGISDVLSAFQSVFEDLELLDEVLEVRADEDRLRNLSLTDLSNRIGALAQESEVLQNIQERTSIVEQLRAAELEDLLDDLSVRHTPAELVASELEQAWWQSALEFMLRENPALLSANTGLVERLESDFRLVDDAHAGGNGAVLATQLADAWRVAVLDNRSEATALRESLKRANPTPERLIEEAPSLMATLAPVWTLSPYEVAQLPRDHTFDCVLLVDAAAMSLVEVLGAVRRGTQVVAFGDPVIQHPAPFQTAVTAAELPESDHVKHSAFDALATVVPELALTRSYRAGGADLTQLVNGRFYDNEIETMPWAGTYLGRSSITHEYVRSGQGLPDEHTGAVESTDAEVERVVRLVLAHANEHPRESLMVITASTKHAARVRQSVYAAFAKFPENRDFLLGEHAEPFTVATLEESTALSRDRVIFSIGYGRTPHGRVLSNFGALGEPGGRRLIAVAMTRARRAMTIVSCFRPEHLDTSRVKHGVAELAEVLTSERAHDLPPELPAEQDPMMADLAERLTQLGLVVTLGYGGGSIPLAASYEDRAIAVDIDFSGEDDDLRHTLRLRPAVSRRLGWHYHRVQSFDLFADPDQVARRIARIVGYNVRQPFDDDDSE